jgi:hypothetical protein
VPNVYDFFRFAKVPILKPLLQFKRLCNDDKIWRKPCESNRWSPKLLQSDVSVSCLREKKTKMQGLWKNIKSTLTRERKRCPYEILEIKLETLLCSSLSSFLWKKTFVAHFIALKMLRQCFPNDTYDVVFLGIMSPLFVTNNYQATSIVDETLLSNTLKCCSRTTSLSKEVTWF